MLILSGLTTSDQVRAVFGASVKDLAESVFTNFDLDTELKLDLREFCTTYQAIIDDSGHGLTAADRLLAYDMLKTYAKYWCALTISSGAQFSILQKVTDGSNEGQRFKEESLAEFRGNLGAKTAKLRTSITEIVSSTVDATPSLFGVANSGYNPVTGS